MGSARMVPRGVGDRNIILWDTQLEDRCQGITAALDLCQDLVFMTTQVRRAELPLCSAYMEQGQQRLQRLWMSQGHPKPTPEPLSHIPYSSFTT